MLILFWKFFLATWLIEPTRLFNFGNFSYLHVISNCTLIKEVRVDVWSAPYGRSSEFFLFSLSTHFQITNQVMRVPNILRFPQNQALTSRECCYYFNCSSFFTFTLSSFLIETCRVLLGIQRGHKVLTPYSFSRPCGPKTLLVVWRQHFSSFCLTIEPNKL